MTTNSEHTDTTTGKMVAPAFVLRTTARKEVDERRTFVRIPYAAAIDYIDGNGFAGNGNSVDIGWGGFSMRLGRYLRPGMRIEIGFHDRGLTEELVGTVTWCRATDGENFVAGLRVSLDDSNAVARLSARMLAAVLHGAQPPAADGQPMAGAFCAPNVA